MRDERTGRDEATVINLIFVFLLPQLWLNTIIQSRKVASFVRPFGAWHSSGGESIKILMSYRECSLNTKGQIGTHWDCAPPALAAQLSGRTPCGPKTDSPSTIAFSVLFSVPDSPQFTRICLSPHILLVPGKAWQIIHGTY